MMKIWQVRDDNDVVLDLGVNGARIEISEAIWQPRLKITERYSSSGVNVSGDQRPKKRTAMAFWDHNFADGDAYRDYVNNILAFFNPANAPFYLEYTDPPGTMPMSDSNIRTEIVLDSFKPKTLKKGTDRLVNNFKLSFVLVSGVFEDLEETSVESLSVGNNVVITIDVDAPLEIYPVISIAADDTLSVFSLINQRNNTGMYISFIDLPNNNLTLDSINGGVTVGSTDISNSIISGGFMKLVGGLNTLDFQNANGTADITITYRKTYYY